MAFVRSRILTLPLAALFVAAGIAQLLGVAPWRDNFFAWGYPDGFRLLVGWVEACAGAGLLLPRAATSATAALGVVMLGAIGTHLRSGQAFLALVPAALLVLVGYAWVRARREARREG